MPIPIVTFRTQNPSTSTWSISDESEDFDQQERLTGKYIPASHDMETFSGVWTNSWVVHQSPRANIDFECHLDDRVIAVIVKAANDIPLFKTHVTREDILELSSTNAGLLTAPRGPKQRFLILLPMSAEQCRHHQQQLSESCRQPSSVSQLNREEDNRAE